MKITGPFLNKQAHHRAKPWYLLIRKVQKNPDGTAVLKDGKLVMQRVRPHYKTKADAIADLPNLRGQAAVAGALREGILSRAHVEDFEQAKTVAPEASLMELAGFWRLHHPLKKVSTVGDLVGPFLGWIEIRLG